jgi:hypothetical protein
VVIAGILLLAIRLIRRDRPAAAPAADGAAPPGPDAATRTPG